MKCAIHILRSLTALVAVLLGVFGADGQINTDQVLNIGRNAMYFEDYILSIQYFNQVINAKPYLAEPYFYRSVAKISLDDFKGAEEDATLSIERNPFITDAYQVRGVARQNLRNFAGAIEDYDAGLRLMPEDKTFLFNKAVCEEALKRYDDADSTYRRLLSIDSRNDRAYLGLAQLKMALTDTASALSMVDKSIELNKNNPNAFSMRSHILMRYTKDYKKALADIEEAIKLDPKFAGYFINRAYMKYNLDDYFGAKSDYDYALGLDPLSVEGHFNRGLLLAEVGENNKAIEDFSFVLRRDATNFIALYNRAMLYSKTGQHRLALTDYNTMLDKYPEFEAGYMARGDVKRRLGDKKGGDRDYDKALSIFKSKKTHTSDFDPSKLEMERMREREERRMAGEEVETSKEVITRFNDLLTVDTDLNTKPEYNNRTRGHVQNMNMDIEPEPMFVLSYYNPDAGLGSRTHYMREITDVNESHLLARQLTLISGENRLSESEIKEHFASIEYYNGLLAAERPRSVDYLGRAMDYFLVKNVEQTVADASRALEISPKFTLAYFLRATALFVKWQMDEKAAAQPAADKSADKMMRDKETQVAMGRIIADLDQVIKLSPKNVYAYFDKGNVYMTAGDLTSAISCYTSAIELKPDMGEAYYNRGLMYMRLGNKERGIADLSKAGELGILPSYNVLKRMR